MTEEENLILKQAEAEVAEETFRKRVEDEKLRVRARKRMWFIWFPWSFRRRANPFPEGWLEKRDECFRQLRELGFEISDDKGFMGTWIYDVRIRATIY